MSGLLADEMGLGKTAQAIAMLAHLRANNVSGPFLVIAPLSLYQSQTPDDCAQKKSACIVLM